MNAMHRALKKLVNEELERTVEKKKDRWRPLLHIAPPVGWLNDPNGLCRYQGEYHAFFQMAPFEPEGGLKFWGHFTSQDMLHWEFQGVPLMPDQTYDCHGVYSGSALVENDVMYVYYTGNVKKLGDYNYITDGRQSNTILAVSRDGKNFESKELLMTNEDYPCDLTMHVRDPKVWKQDGIYYMVLGARTKKNEGIVLIYTSRDKKNWSYLSRIKSDRPFGYMWECPDLYELDGKMILSISPQGVEQEGWKYANKYQSVVCALNDDFRTDAVVKDFQELDGGFDFYAPQTFLTDDGRRIQIGWMGMADATEEYTNPTVKDGWQNVLTLPRELSWKDNVLCQNPVRELDDWWNVSLDFEQDYEGKIHPCSEIYVENKGENLEIVLSKGLILSYDGMTGFFRMEFKDSKLGAGRTVRERKVDQLEQVRIIVDVSCVEVFLNGGKEVFSTRFYPETEKYDIEIRGSHLKGCLRYRNEEK